MIGLNIGLGMGLGYNKPLVGGKVVVSPPEPEPDITDALLMEDGTLFMMEDGSYFRLESGGVNTLKIEKSYWNF